MILIGSCDASIYAVHPTAHISAFAGDVELERGRYTQNYGARGQVGYIPFLVNDPVGEARTWNYQFDGIPDPQVWIVRDAAGIVQRGWEAESGVDKWNREFVPIYEKDKNGAAVVSAGGSLIKMVKPGWDGSAEILDLLNAEVSAAALPDWIADTRFENQLSASDLLRELFLQMQIKRSIVSYGDIDSVHQYVSVDERKWYTLLWLRAVSMICQDHRGETCIPLVKNRFLVDEDGYASLI